jgi:hypothetical protein
LRFQITHAQFLGEAELDLGDAVTDLARDKLLAAPRDFRG